MPAFAAGRCEASRRIGQTALALRTAESRTRKSLPPRMPQRSKSKRPFRTPLLAQLSPKESGRLLANSRPRWSAWPSKQKVWRAKGIVRPVSTPKKLEAQRFSRELSDARERVAKLQAERETAVDAVIRGHEAVSDTEAELTRVRDEHSRASHRLESLKVDQRRAYYSPAVQLIFSPTETPRDFHFIGTLADALNVDAKWERAVEGVLGSSLQSIVVPTPTMPFVRLSCRKRRSCQFSRGRFARRKW